MGKKSSSKFGLNSSELGGYFQLANYLDPRSESGWEFVKPRSYGLYSAFSYGFVPNFIRSLLQSRIL